MERESREGIRNPGEGQWQLGLGGSGEAEEGRTLEYLTTGEPVESSGELGVKSEGTRGMKTGFENFGLSNRRTWLPGGSGHRQSRLGIQIKTLALDAECRSLRPGREVECLHGQ